VVNEGAVDEDARDAEPGQWSERTVAGLEPEAAPRDIRQEAADEPARDDGHDPEAVRVPSADETAESVRRAQRALAELRQRQAIEEQRDADEARERDDDLARWHADTVAARAANADTGAATQNHSAAGSTDPAADRTDQRSDEAAADTGPVLEVTAPDDY
jgi:hypothetical protein